MPGIAPQLILRPLWRTGLLASVSFRRTRFSPRLSRPNRLAVAIQSWSELQERLGLQALGYRKVLWLHLHCASHGVYRLGLGEEQEQYLCPTCQQACKVSVLAEGFTKQPLPFAPELIDEPLPRWWVARIGADLEGDRAHRARTPRRYVRQAVAVGDQNVDTA